MNLQRNHAAQFKKARQRAILFLLLSALGLSGTSILVKLKLTTILANLQQKNSSLLLSEKIAQKNREFLLLRKNNLHILEAMHSLQEFQKHSINFKTLNFSEQQIFVEASMQKKRLTMQLECWRQDHARYLVYIYQC